MKCLSIIFLLIIASCSQTTQLDPISCLNQIDSISATNTFREAIKPAELCVNQNTKDTKLNLRLSELYLLTYLVDNKKEGLDKSSNQFTQTLYIDSTFKTNSSDFNLKEGELLEFVTIWNKIKDDSSLEKEKERILIWFLIEKCDSKKEPKLIK